MFEAVSWSRYFQFLLIALIIYYLVIGLLFYRKELSALIRKRSDVDKRIVALTEENADDQLLEELREVQHAITHSGYTKEELLQTIRQKVSQYKVGNQAMINQFLEEAFPELEDPDRRRIWQ